MAGGVRLSKGWNDVLRATDPRSFERRWEENLERAGERIGRDFRRLARREIRQGNYAPNSPVTIILKGSSKPLVDGGDLFQSITHEVVSPRLVRLGVIRQVSGDKLVNIGAALHDGFVVDMNKHPQVRKALWAKVRDASSKSRMQALKPAPRKAVKSAQAQLARSRSRGGGKRQLNAYFARNPSSKIPGDAGGPKLLVIPARPFITQPMLRPEFGEAVLQHYGDAVKATFGGTR